MVARFLNIPRIHELGSESPPIDEDESDEQTAGCVDNKQSIPVRCAYNSSLQIPLDVYAHTDVNQALGLPISNAPAHEWSTLIIALDQLSRVNEVVTL
jgi:hypothetical protein